MRSSIHSAAIKIISTLCLFLAPASVTSGQGHDQSKQEIQQALVEEGLTGAVWAIVNANEEITVSAAGFKNRQTKEPLKPTDKVHIGSITKTVLAVGILRLASEGKIDLDHPVEKYTPEISFDNKWRETHPVTVRHLLDHTSGLEDLRLWQMFTATASQTSTLSHAFEKDRSVLRVRTRPGSMFAYSNMGYTLLGMVVEKVVNGSYENYLDENLLQPLGMFDSTFGFVSQVGGAADAGLAMGHLDNQTAFPALPIFLRPAAQFTTTAHDMALFLKFVMSDGSVGGKPFVKTELLREMGRPQATDAFRHGLRAGYGLGVMQRDRHGVTGFAHAGNIVGYHAMIYAFPGDRKAFFISHNTDSESANYERFNEILIKYLNLEINRRTANAVNPTELSDWEGYYTPVVPKLQPLAYLDALASFTNVRVEDARVMLSPFQKPTRELYYAGNNLLIADGKVNVSHVFYRNEDGAPLISDGFSSLRKINGVYLLGHWVSFCLGVSGLLYLLVSGVIQSIKYKGQVVKQPVWFAFASLLLLFVPVPFFLSQPFVAIGDLTVASVMLAISTCLLPVGLVMSARLYIKSGTPDAYSKTDFLALLLSVQWVATLALWGLIPFFLWV